MAVAGFVVSAPVADGSMVMVGARFLRCGAGPPSGVEFGSMIHDQARHCRLDAAPCDGEARQMDGASVYERSGSVRLCR